MDLIITVGIAWLILAITLAVFISHFSWSDKGLRRGAILIFVSFSLGLVLLIGAITSV